MAKHPTKPEIKLRLYLGTEKIVVFSCEVGSHHYGISG